MELSRDPDGVLSHSPSSPIVSHRRFCRSGKSEANAHQKLPVCLQEQDLEAELEKAAHCMTFAAAAYGWPLYVYSNPFSAPCKLSGDWSEPASVFRPCRRRRAARSKPQCAPVAAVGATPETTTSWAGTTSAATSPPSWRAPGCSTGTSSTSASTTRYGSICRSRVPVLCSLDLCLPDLRNPLLCGSGS